MAIRLPGSRPHQTDSDEQQERQCSVSSVSRLASGLNASYSKQTHARILLMSDESRSDGGCKHEGRSHHIALARCAAGQPTVREYASTVWRRLAGRLIHRTRTASASKGRLEYEGEARLIAMDLGGNPGGACQLERLKLLMADHLVECEKSGPLARETVRQALQKKHLPPWLKQSWFLHSARPPHSAAFVTAMEERTGGLPTAVRGTHEVHGAHGSETPQTDRVSQGDASAASRSARLLGGIDLRIRAQWSEQPVHDVCTTSPRNEIPSQHRTCKIIRWTSYIEFRALSEWDEDKAQYNDRGTALLLKKQQRLSSTPSTKRAMPQPMTNDVLSLRNMVPSLQGAT